MPTAVSFAASIAVSYAGILSALFVPFLLQGCAANNNLPEHNQALKGRAFDIGRLRVTDLQGHALPPEILETAQPGPVKVSFDGQILDGQSAQLTKFNTVEKLSEKIKNKLNGSFLFLPWAKTTALVSGYSAISLPNMPDKMLICGAAMKLPIKCVLPPTKPGLPI